ncbi:hypothetical protein PIB30_061082 [Stylosanthes scabra]|uniref:Uncharacterized protein n=1 Tax=Stylosanthes scabra TaxID=79078 RepID=A0ABU6SMJ6_9FABA|nr:hypothetical protein [Stylosanthes scabra]
MDPLGPQIVSDVLIFEYPADGRYVHQCSGEVRVQVSTTFLNVLSLIQFLANILIMTCHTTCHSPSCTRVEASILFSPYPLDVAEPDPEFPMPQVPKYPTWFDPASELIIPNESIPAAPSPSPNSWSCHQTLALRCGLTRC